MNPPKTRRTDPFMITSMTSYTNFNQHSAAKKSVMTFGCNKKNCTHGDSNKDKVELTAAAGSISETDQATSPNSKTETSAEPNKTFGERVKGFFKAIWQWITGLFKSIGQLFSTKALAE